MNVSDGAAVQVMVVPDKIRPKIDDEDWKKSFEKFTIIKILGSNLKVQESAQTK